MAERISVKICSFKSHAARFLSVILFFRFVLGLVSERVDRIKPRSALLTASSFGKAFATCGSRTTTFVDSRIRLAYLQNVRDNSMKKANSSELNDWGKREY